MTTGTEEVALSRDVSVVQIPQGDSLQLGKGTKVIITQSLGGSYTVHVASLSGLYRISGADADALGKEAEKGPGEKEGSGEFQESAVWEVLKTCYDPEIPVNIVDLGLIYSMEPKALPQGGKRVDVKMTLTAPGCGMGPSIAADAKAKILRCAGVEEAEVEVVWEPAWNPGMISDEGKAKLGIA